MIGIRGEIPHLKRCCMCLPLRHGLIVWGYIRLVIGVILFVCATTSFFQTLATFKNETGDIVMFGFLVILGGADIVLNVVFVYAGHTINLKMLKAYSMYSFILWILMIIMGVSLIAYALHVMKLYEMNFMRVCISMFDVTVYFLAPIVIQAYVLLLVRSEFIKLTTNCEFRFVNNADESACKMKCEEDDMRELASHQTFGISLIDKRRIQFRCDINLIKYKLGKILRYINVRSVSSEFIQSNFLT